MKLRGYSYKVDKLIIDKDDNLTEISLDEILR